MKIGQKIERTESFKERLKGAMNWKGISQSDLVRLTNIPKSALSQYLSGAFEPKKDRLSVLAQSLNVSEAWLMGYDVPMRRPQEKVYTYDNNHSCYSESENPIMLEIYGYLDTLSQSELIAELEHLKAIDAGREIKGYSILTSAELSKEEIQVALAYRNQQEAVKSAINRMLSLSNNDN